MFKFIAKELKEFILRGSVLDMAVGIIIGAAFGKVIDSMVKDIIMPPIGMLMGKVDFSNLYLQIYPRDVRYPSLETAQAAGAVTINYGIFFNTLISFLVVAFAVFMLIKFLNKLKKAEAITVKECPYCCSQISINAKKCPNCTSELG